MVLCPGFPDTISPVHNSPELFLTSYLFQFASPETSKCNAAVFPIEYSPKIRKEHIRPEVWIFSRDKPFSNIKTTGLKWNFYSLLKTRSPWVKLFNLKLELGRRKDRPLFDLIVRTIVSG